MKEGQTESGRGGNTRKRQQQDKCGGIRHNERGMKEEEEA